jgi:DNA-directed RNA polymerase subunit M/transcription elongation factor TFIIS
MESKLCPKCGRFMYPRLTPYGKEYNCICGNEIKNPYMLFSIGERNMEMRLKHE